MASTIIVTCSNPACYWCHPRIINGTLPSYPVIANPRIGETVDVLA